MCVSICSPKGEFSLSKPYLYNLHDVLFCFFSYKNLSCLPITKSSATNQLLQLLLGFKISPGGHSKEGFWEQDLGSSPATGPTCSTTPKRPSLSSNIPVTPPGGMTHPISNSPAPTEPLGGSLFVAVGWHLRCHKVPCSARMLVPAVQSLSRIGALTMESYEPK